MERRAILESLAVRLFVAHAMARILAMLVASSQATSWNLSLKKSYQYAVLKAPHPASPRRERRNMCRSILAAQYLQRTNLSLVATMQQQ